MPKKIEFNKLRQARYPTIYIAKKNKKIIGSIHGDLHLKIVLNLNDISTAEFEYHRKEDGELTPYYDELIEERLIFIRKFGWFKIHVEITSDENGEIKKVSASSLEIELQNELLINLEINTDIDIERDEYVITRFYNPTNPKGSLLHRCMEQVPAWSIGHVDTELWDMQRTFQESSIDILSFFRSTVSDELKCLFLFDTFNREINVYNLETYGKDTNIFISLKNLANKIEVSCDESKLKTCLYIEGGDNIDIAEINPNGTSRIMNFDYFKKDMSKELVDKLNQYDNYYSSIIDTYQTLILEMNSAVDKKTELLYTMFPQHKQTITDGSDTIVYDVPEKEPITSENLSFWKSYWENNWKNYCLTGLESVDGLIKWRTYYKTIEESYIDLGYSMANSPFYNDYSSNHAIYLLLDGYVKQRMGESEVQSNGTYPINEYGTKDTSVRYWKDKIDDFSKQIRQIQDSLNIKNYMGEDLYKELSLYKITDVYQNNNYVYYLETETDSERIQKTRDLLDKANKELLKVCYPQYEFTVDTSNLLMIPEFDTITDNYFELGNFIHLGVNEKYIIHMRMISMEFDFDNLDSINIIFSDMLKVQNTQDDIKSIIEQANSSAVSYNFNKSQYDNASNQTNFVRDLKLNGLEAATTEVVNASNQNFIFDEYGIWGRKYNPEKDDYENEQMRIINNKIVFSDDAFNSSKLAVGKILYGNQCLYGLIADVIIGDLVVAQQMSIMDSNGYVKITGNGVELSGGKITWTTQINRPDINGLVEFITNTSTALGQDIPTTEIGSDYIISPHIGGGYLFIYDPNYGSVCIDPTQSSSTSNGHIFNISDSTGQSIMAVDLSGNAYFKGTISASNIYSSNMSGSTITGGSINIGNGIFTVDSNGNLTATSGNFTGSISSSTITGGSITGASIVGGTISTTCGSCRIASDGIYITEGGEEGLVASRWFVTHQDYATKGDIEGIQRQIDNLKNKIGGTGDN